MPQITARQGDVIARNYEKWGIKRAALEERSRLCIPLSLPAPFATFILLRPFVGRTVQVNSTYGSWEYALFAKRRARLFF